MHRSAEGRSRSPARVAIVAAALILWVCATARPLGDAWLEGPLSDDAYYYLSVARSIATGEGPTYGGRLTNGYQPLQLVATVALGSIVGWGEWQTPFSLFLWNVLVYFVLGPLVLAWALRPFVARAPHVQTVAIALWCFGPMAAFTPLGQETPLALVAWVAMFGAFLAFVQRPTRTVAGSLGAIIGLAFLCRNDAAILAIGCGVLVLLGERTRAVLVGLAVAALVSFVAALPWLVFNFSAFGSPVPQSGYAEALGGIYDRGRIAQLEATSKALARYLVSLNLPLDRVWEANRTAGALSSFVLIAVGSAGALVTRGSVSREQRLVYSGLLLGAGGLAATYLLAFGAPHMVLRWLAPVGLVGLTWVALVAGRTRIRAILVCGLAVSLTAAKLAASHHESTPRTNTYVLARFLEQFPCEARPATLQSGLPHWLNRCVENIDGKVNGRALAAIRAGRYELWIAEQRFGVVADFDLLGVDDHPAVRRVYRRRSGPTGLIVLEPRHAVEAKQGRSRSRTNDEPLRETGVGPKSDRG